MRLVLALAAVAALAVAVAGCGGGAKSPVTLRSGSSDCDLKEITTGARREGVCTARGVTITVANRAHWLHGQDYDAHVLSVRTAGTLRTGSGGKLRAHDRFVIVRLSIKNTLDAPHEFDRPSDLVFLFVDRKYF